MNEYECKKYITTPNDLKKTLDKYGVAIIPNVLNSEECNKMINDIWDYFECITKSSDKPIKKNDNLYYNNEYI